VIALVFGWAFAQDPPPDDLDPRRLELSVSRSRGPTDGVVVLWPRVMPLTLDAEVLAAAAAMQGRMDQTAQRASPLARRELRPDPERVCPKARGCRAASLTVLIGHEAGGCVAVAVIGRPGLEPLELVPLAGSVDLSATTVPFRAPPESVVTVREFVPCSGLVSAVDDTAAVLALRRAME
jgi:hypothetical protein